MTATIGARSAIGSSIFAADLDVLGFLGLRLVQDATLARPVFSDDCWDFSAVADVPAYARVNHMLRVRWSGIANPVWRLCAKELAVALLQPGVGLDHRLPRATRRAMPPHDLGRFLSDVRRWFRWLEGHGVSHLGDVSQGHCDAWLSGRLEEVGRRTVSGEVVVLRRLADYGAILTLDAYRPGFRPWGDQTAARVTGAKSRHGENTTPVMADDVFGPVLAGALFLVQVAAPDVLAARDEWDRLRGSPSVDAGSSIDERLDRYLDQLRAEGRGLPALHQRHIEHKRARGTLDESDPLHRVNLRMVERHIGTWGQAVFCYPARRARVRGALDEVGLVEGGLRTEVSEVADPANPANRRPWHDDFSPWEIDDLADLVLTASYIVVAALSGMRFSELAEMRRGCVRPEKLANGKVRYRVHAQLIKGRDFGGEPQRWTVIEEVAHAFNVAERLVGDERPFARRSFTRRFAKFVRWVNGPGSRAFLAPIPEHQPLTARQFRRTLARLVGFRPHGVLAGKIHLKHVSVATSEGYYGRPGSSAAAFLAEVERERATARIEATTALYAGWVAGEPATGPGRDELRSLFAAVHAEMASFEGTVVESEQRVVELLRRRASTLHVGPLNHCWFVDPARARCLAQAGRSGENAPLLGMCEPTRCANATIHPEHVPVWIDTERRVDRLLASIRVPAQEKERLVAERTRVHTIVAAAGRAVP